MPPINEQKSLLEQVVKNALNRAINEIIICENLFSEEALRYIVMDELSKMQIWGQFPNNKQSEKRLVFEFAYPKFKRKVGTFRPDIASLNIDKNGNVLTSNSLAIELKVADWATQDIVKCRNYLDPKQGKINFDLAAVIIAPLPKKRALASFRTSERKRIQQQKRFINKSDLKILYGWINPEHNKPEIFWIS